MYYSGTEREYHVNCIVCGQSLYKHRHNYCPNCGRKLGNAVITKICEDVEYWIR